MPAYDYISPEVMESTRSIASFSNAISYIALAVLIILIFKGSYPLLLVSEIFQMFYFHFFIIEELPYNFSSFLLNLSPLNFTFLPNVFMDLVPSDFSSSGTINKFTLAFPETTFFISSGHYWLVIVCYIAWALMTALLQSKYINKWESLQQVMQRVYYTRVRFGAVN